MSERFYVWFGDDVPIEDISSVKNSLEVILETEVKQFGRELCFAAWLAETAADWKRKIFHVKLPEDIAMLIEWPDGSTTQWGD